jgi:arabinose-5-phosphate isomerase
MTPMTDRPQDAEAEATARATIARVLREEAAAVAAFADRSGDCAAAALLIDGTPGPLVVSGIGKSGHVGGKIASTFRSLGKPAVFVHPAEASHGDLGLLQRGCAALVLSNSGETTELSDVLHHCRTHDIPVIGITGRADSALARASRVAIVYGAVAEACRNRLAPTTSTTLMLAIGDALAVAVSELMGAEPEDFRRFHPGGRLGARLLTVGQVMRTGADVPLVDPGAAMSDVVVTMSEKALGVAVLSRAGEIAGIITDGDLRRNAARLWEARPLEIATRDPVRIAPGMLVAEAMALMSARKITACIVADAQDRITGILHIHDCIRSGAAD